MSEDHVNSQESRERIAQMLGLSPDGIRKMDGNWLHYMQEGVIVNLHIGRWRARTKLELSDLGLPEPEDPDEIKALSDLLVLGRKNLLPTRFIKKFDSIESGARKFLHETCFQTHWGAFVTAQQFHRVIDRLGEFYADYFSTMREMIDTWDDVRQEWVDEYQALARKAFYTLQTLAPDLIDKDENEFIHDFIYSIRDIVPPASEIETSFHFNWELSYIPLPSMIAQDEVEAQSIYHDAEIDLQERRELSDMRREVAREAQSQKRELVNGFMRDLVVQLRTMVYDATTDVLETMQKNDRLHPRSVVQLRNLIDQISDMNFFNDAEINQMINQVRAQLTTNPDDRDTKEISRTLQAVGILTRNALIGLGENPRSARAMGIADVPTIADVRTARTSLAMPLADIPELLQRSARITIPTFEAALV